MFKAKILGSGGWEGLPSPFCNCKICRQAVENPSSKNFRTRPEILVESESGNFLIEISPDIRLQSMRNKLPEIKNFLVSHWHFDHLYGLFELGAWSEFILNESPKIYCSQQTTDWLNDKFGHIRKEIVTLQPLKSFDILGLSVTPLPVYHMRRRDEALSEDELNNTFGYLVERDEYKVAYLADYYELPPKTLEAVHECDIVIMDGTYLFDELFPAGPTQDALKGDGDSDHLHGKNILELAKKISAKKTVFHSINHLTGKTHEELQELLPEGMFISFDGMEL